MSEHVGTPFTAYNNAGAPEVLTGNYFEERALLAATGVARLRPVAGAAAAADGALSGSDQRAVPDTDASARMSVFPEPGDSKVAAVPTFRRVIEHAEQQVTCGRCG